MSIILNLLVVIFTFLTLPMPGALANDGVFGGKGFNLVPLKENRIKMLSEDILIQEKENSWQVKAVYQFKNPTSQPVKIQVGFPEAKCPRDSDCNSERHSWTIYDFKTFKNGSPIPHTIGKVSKEFLAKIGQGFDYMDRVYLFELSFKPFETLQITHTYRHAAEGWIEGKPLRYITKTGQLWNGPIGKARFTIHAKGWPMMTVYSKDFILKSLLDISQDNRKALSEYIFEMKNWIPKQNLEMTIVDSKKGFYFLSLKEVESCPQINQAPKELKNEIKKLSLEQKNICRNAVFAMHGYVFKNPKWKKLFYQNTERYAPGWYEAKKQNFIGLKENPKINFNRLSDYEKKYVKLLRSSVAN